MSDIKTIEGDFTGGKGNYAIVVGRWNSFVVDSLEAGAIDTLKRHGTPEEDITVVRLPAATEGLEGRFLDPAVLAHLQEQLQGVSAGEASHLADGVGVFHLPHVAGVQEMLFDFIGVIPHRVSPPEA